MDEDLKEIARDLVRRKRGGPLAPRRSPWKYNPPSDGPRLNVRKNIETGNDPSPQLYNVVEIPGESENLAAAFPDKEKEMSARLDELRATCGRLIDER